MSRRIQDRESLDYYNDFLLFPEITQPADPTDATGFSARHFGTGNDAVQPASAGAPEAEHPGSVKLTTVPDSDNAQIFFKQGVVSKLKDWTRFSCTFRITALMTADELAYANPGLFKHNTEGQTALYVFRPVSYAYHRPNEWAWPGSFNTGRTYGGGLVWPATDSQRDTKLVEWHNYDIRLNYEMAEIRHYLDGELITVETNVPESMWTMEARPSLSFGDPALNTCLIDEWGWATRKGGSDRSIQVVSAIETTRPFSRTTRRDNRG